LNLLQRADEEAARLYKEFVEFFKADDVPGGKTFVRGGTINPNDRAKPSSESVPPSKFPPITTKVLGTALPYHCGEGFRKAQITRDLDDASCCLWVECIFWRL
jgi:hypothetical protein